MLMQRQAVGTISLSSGPSASENCTRFSTICYTDQALLNALNWESWYHREQTTCWVAVGPKQVTDGIRGSPGHVCPQVSSQFGLALLSSLLLAQPTIACHCNAPFACVCARTLAGPQYWSPPPRHFSRPPAKSSSDARRLPCSLHPQILAAYALLQLALPWAPAVERPAAFAWVLRLRLRVAMM